MDYYCKECGMIIREEDAEEEEEFIGEAWGRPQYITYITCPKCGEVIEEFYGDDEEIPKFTSDLADGADYFHPRRRD